MLEKQINSDKGSILIVDDIPANVELLASFLNCEGYRTKTVNNSEEVLSIAKQLNPDLILLDVMMPKMDGYQVCRQLKEDKVTCDIPVIFVSGISSLSDKVKAFSTGAVDYITKPFQLQEVLARVGTHVTLRSLQKNLQFRHEELAKTLEQLKKTQAQLVQSEKMVALGQLVAGVAHEVNSPLGAIRSSVENISSFLNKIEELPFFFQQLSSEELETFLKLIREDRLSEGKVSSKERRKLRKEFTQVLSSRNIADVDIVADILIDLGGGDRLDHLLPLLKRSYGLEVLETAYNYFSLRKSTQTIITASEQAKKVVLALKDYSRHSKDDNKSLANVTEGIETILTLYRNKLRYGIEVVRNYSAVPAIVCNPDQLNQVWTNLIQNAIQAMDGKGTLTIEVAQVNNRIKISIADTGKGIPKEIEPQIFKPFFTTKPAGKGSGLGLDISKTIVEKHQGEIFVESNPGSTVFTVYLPINIEEKTFYI